MSPLRRYYQYFKVAVPYQVVISACTLTIKIYQQTDRMHSQGLAAQPFGHAAQVGAHAPSLHSRNAAAHIVFELH